MINIQASQTDEFFTKFHAATIPRCKIYNDLIAVNGNNDQSKSIYHEMCYAFRKYFNLYQKQMITNGVCSLDVCEKYCNELTNELINKLQNTSETPQFESICRSWLDSKRICDSINAGLGERSFQQTMTQHLNIDHIRNQVAPDTN